MDRQTNQIPKHIPAVLESVTKLSQYVKCLTS